MYKSRTRSSSSFFSTPSINTFALKTGRKSKSPTSPPPLGQPSDWYCCYGCCHSDKERCWERQCEETDCPIKEPHLNGPYYFYKAEPREYSPEEFLWPFMFRLSNPPPHIWDAAELVERTHHRKLNRRQTEAEKIARREPIWMVDRFQQYHMHPRERPASGAFELRASDVTTVGRKFCPESVVESVEDGAVCGFSSYSDGCHTFAHELPANNDNNDEDNDDDNNDREVFFECSPGNMEAEKGKSPSHKKSTNFYYSYFSILGKFFK